MKSRKINKSTKLTLEQITRNIFLEAFQALSDRTTITQNPLDDIIRHFPRIVNEIIFLDSRLASILHTSRQINVNSTPIIPEDVATQLQEMITNNLPQKLDHAKRIAGIEDRHFIDFLSSLQQDDGFVSLMRQHIVDSLINNISIQNNRRRTSIEDRSGFSVEETTYSINYTDKQRNAVHSFPSESRIPINLMLVVIKDAFICTIQETMK